MAESTELEKAAEQLRQAAAEYANMDLEKLLRLELGKEASFEPLKESFLALQSFAKRIAQCSWKGLPLPVIQTCQSKLNQMKSVIEYIQRFNLIRSSNPAGERANYISNFAQNWAEVYNYISPHLCFAESVDNGADRYKEVMAMSLAEANSAKEEFKKSLTEQQSAMKADQERMKTLVAEVEKMAKNAGVTNQAVHFKKLADNYAKIGALWMALGLAAGIGLYLYVRDLQLPDIKDPLLLAEHLVPRLVAVTLLSTALIFCIRNFSAMMHNLIVNRHRQTALTTFQVFVNGTSDDGTKNAVLVQSTQAIFAPQPSGYLKTDQEMPQMNQITEIVRGVTGKDQK
jgi:hypothetical protein